jgi:hypothetical protein
MGMGMVGVVNGCSPQPAPAYGRLTIQEDDLCEDSLFFSSFSLVWFSIWVTALFYCFNHGWLKTAKGLELNSRTSSRSIKFSV